MDWFGLLLPVAYLTVLVGSLATFSHLYRARKAAKSASLEPWFPPHVARNVYLSLLHLDPSDADSRPPGAEKALSRVPDSIIKAALLRRAVEDISRVIQIRSSKSALQALLQQGSVGEELWERFQRAETEIDEECKDVMNEVSTVRRESTTVTDFTQANALSPNWGQHIFASADQIYHQRILKEQLAEMPTRVEAEKEWWTKRKQGIQQDFMKEIGADAPGRTKDVEAVGKKPSTPKIGSKSGSDDDAVLVEGGGPTGVHGPPSSGTSTPASGSSSKKKKKAGNK